MSADYDYIVIGSGFGGSVSTLRLTEKGYRVGVMEKGKRPRPAELRVATAYVDEDSRGEEPHDESHSDAQQRGEWHAEFSLDSMRYEGSDLERDA